jgi:hypothetical protein
MPQIKICPDCTTEYFAHIESCADCGAVLLSPEENRSVQEERKQCRERALENPVVVSEGDLKWMDELFNVLIDSSIPCLLNTDAGCNKGCCGDKYRLQVSAQDAERANERIQEYYAEVHPEIQASKEMMSQGKCPACGSPVNPDTVECPDCGLTLLIIE